MRKIFSAIALLAAMTLSFSSCLNGGITPSVSVDPQFPREITFELIGGEKLIGSTAYTNSWWIENFRANGKTYFYNVVPENPDPSITIVCDSNSMNIQDVLFVRGEWFAVEKSESQDNPSKHDLYITIAPSDTTYRWVSFDIVTSSNNRQSVLIKQE